MKLLHHIQEMNKGVVNAEEELEERKKHAKKEKEKVENLEEEDKYNN